MVKLSNGDYCDVAETDGCVVGEIEVPEVGPTVAGKLKGIAVGGGDGVRLGFRVSENVGLTVGGGEGAGVGLFTGANVGCFVVGAGDEGARVGLPTGADEGLLVSGVEEGTVVGFDVIRRLVPVVGA